MTTVSSKGWMQPIGPGLPHRLTAEQAKFLVLSMSEIILRSSLQKGVADALVRTVQQVVAEYPKDRSCKTCDWEEDGYCLKWEKIIPVQHVNAGCGEHCTEGIPRTSLFSDIPF